jgi:hypothetical protein
LNAASESVVVFNAPRFVALGAENASLTHSHRQILFRSPKSFDPAKKMSNPMGKILSDQLTKCVRSLHFMNVEVKYIDRTHKFCLSSDATVGDLSAALFSATGIAPIDQKLIFRGRPVSGGSTSLSSCKVAHGAKLLLVAAPPPPKSDSLMDGGDHIPASVAELGPPPGAGKAFMAQLAIFPKSPFVVRTPKGVAQFSVETDAFYIQFEDGSAHRMFNTDMRRCLLQKIGREYFGMHFTTKTDTFWVAFIPVQYLEIMKATLPNQIQMQFPRAWTPNASGTSQTVPRRVG